MEPSDKNGRSSFEPEYKNAEYGLLTGHAEGNAEKNHDQTNRFKKRTLPCSMMHLHIILIGFYTLIFLLLVSRAKPSTREVKPLIHSPLNDVLVREKKLVNATFRSDNPFKGKPSPEIDHAWHELFVNSNVRVTAADLKRINKTSVPIGDGNGQANKPDPHRADHCIDNLRQNLMCKADVSLLTFDWVDNDRAPKPNFAIEHECHNWDRIEEWAKEHAFDIFDETTLVHPTLGPSFPETEYKQTGKIPGHAGFLHGHGEKKKKEESDEVLQTALPISACAISALILAFHARPPVWQSQKRADNRTLYETAHHPSSFSSIDQPWPSLEEGQTGLALSAIPLTFAFEVFLDICLICVHVAAITIPIRHINPAAGVSLAVWVYFGLLLAASALVHEKRASLITPHRIVVLLLNWLIIVLSFRSEILYPESYSSSVLSSIDLLLASALLLIELLRKPRPVKPSTLREASAAPICPEGNASILSRAVFGWVDSLLLTKRKHGLDVSDLWDLPQSDKAKTVLAEYNRDHKSQRLIWSFLRHFSSGLLLQGFWAVLAAVFTFIPVLLLKKLLEYIENPLNSTVNAAWLYVVLLLIFGCLKAATEGQTLWIGQHLAVQLRILVLNKVYSKILRIKLNDEIEDSPTPKKGGESPDTEEEPGHHPRNKPPNHAANVTNLMSIDSFKIADATDYLHFLWASVPTEVIFGVALLYSILGYASIAGLAIMVALLPAKVYIARAFSRIQVEMMEATDDRIDHVNELFRNIRLIKYFVLEDHFVHDVDSTRAVELRRLRRRFIYWTLTVVIYNTTPLFITLFSFMIYTVVEKKALKPSTAFPALSLFALLRIPLDKIASTLANVQQAKVSIDRVETYLKDLKTEKPEFHAVSMSHPLNEAISMRGVHAAWPNSGSSGFQLHDVDIEFVSQGLNLVIGATGSGKTSLLMTLLGEMKLVRGRVSAPSYNKASARDLSKGNGVSYCAQQAWLMNDTIRENIIFGEVFDNNRYDQVVGACALIHDFKTLQDGDCTMVGEKGTKLSGGQKQRVALARALYSSNELIILDDCLSSLDASTSLWVLEKGICGPLTRNRTCILATHNLELTLKRTNHVVILRNGRVDSQAHPNQGFNPAPIAVCDVSTEDEQPTRFANSHSVLDRRTTFEKDRDGVGLESPNFGQEDVTRESRSLVTECEEGRDTGVIRLSLFWWHFRAMGGSFFWLVMFTLFFANQISTLAIDLWIREWANAANVRHHRRPGQLSTTSLTVQQARSEHGKPDGFHKKPEEIISHLYDVTQSRNWVNQVNNRYYLLGYILIAAVFMLVKAVRMATLFMGSLRASRLLHAWLLQAMIKARFQFYDCTPLGQIVNRFSRDIEIIDQELAPILLGYQHAIFSVLTILILISVITPAFLLPGILILLVYFLIGTLFVKTCRDLKRLESALRSPLYQHFEETVSGKVTIRAYGHEERFLKDLESKLESHCRAYLYLGATNTWLAFRINIASALIVFFAAAFAVLRVGKIDAGLAGLALSYAMTFSEHILWMVKLYGQNEQNMVSVERIKRFTDIPSEGPEESSVCTPQTPWPKEGAIEIRKLSMRYRENLPLVLSDVDLVIKPGEKIIIVGRTGSGKSSLALALLRTAEPHNGCIMIDGIDTRTLNLHMLRDAVVIVPQDPTIFKGSLRSNLDPHCLFTDEEIFTTLRQVSLIPSPQGMEASTFMALDAPVPPMSLGQRQLLCLVRALMRKPKILVLDEATASVDEDTERKIQNIVQSVHCTTIIIAHRLANIDYCDRVVEMERGKIVKIRSPADFRLGQSQAA
ncbi:MAG: hypothetical protein Q9217_004200 [Psora testacea]